TVEHQNGADDETNNREERPSNGTQRKTSPFRRVKDEDADPEYLKLVGKNSFDNKHGARGSWGEKASQDLINTRGKSFRHEKTKKKRGSYRGGKIDTQIYSIQFDDSE
ncbi:unnamed protein product, partial [Didymodactylos carnosus]